MSMEVPKPTFFVAGAAKAGTTSLHRYLGQHPEIFTTETKEVHFFTHGLEGCQTGRERKAAWSAYLDRFRAGADAEHRGESTPGYLHFPPAAERIREYVGPEVRLIVSLRDPLERAHSDWFQRYSGTGPEDRDFAKALVDEIQDRDSPNYIRRGLYDEHLERLIDLFGRDRLTIVRFAELEQNTEGVVADVLDDLGLEPCLDQIDTERVHNPGGSPISETAEKVLEADTIRRAARAVVPKRARIWIGEQLLRDQGKPSISDRAREIGRQRFGPVVDRTEELLDRELPDLRRSW